MQQATSWQVGFAHQKNYPQRFFGSTPVQDGMGWDDSKKYPLQLDHATEGFIGNTLSNIYIVIRPNLSPIEYY